MECERLSAIVACVLAVGCGRDPAASGSAGSGSACCEPRQDAGSAAAAAPSAPIVSAGGVTARAYTDLASALTATIPPDVRVIGFGELHARTDRAPGASALAAFTTVLPQFAPQLSDLVVETWLVDPRCGQAATAATTAMETAVARPAATKSEIARLADAARAGGVQPHAMTLGCADYAAMAPGGGAPDPVAMLTITTRELTRVTTSALEHRARERGRDAGVLRPWIALYGGALHNDRYPAAGVAEWSYADTIDLATAGRYVEIDLIGRRLAAADPSSQRQPWFPLVDVAAERVLVWERGERSYVVVLAE